MIINLKNNSFIRAVLPSILLTICVGSIYAFSLFVNDIAEYIDATQQQVQFAFSLGIFFLGTGAATFGKYVEKNITRAGSIGSILFLIGLFITSIAIQVKSLWLLYIGYGAFVGMGTGIIYLTPVKTLMLWYSKHKGLASSIPVVSFGLGSSLCSYLYKLNYPTTGIEHIFMRLGSIYGVLLLLGILLLAKPNNHVEKDENKTNFKYWALLKDSYFIRIWLIMFINISCGLALIGVAAPLMKEAQLPSATIISIIAIMGLFNGGGRLFFAGVADYLKHRINIYLIFLACSIIVTFLGLIHLNLIIITLIIISACYGAGFSNLPSLLSERYGMDNISKIHGFTLTAWAIAGLVGNQFSIIIRQCFGSYTKVLPFLIVLYLVAFGLSYSLRSKVGKNK